MLKITGIILCIAGSAGYGWIQVSSWKSNLQEAKNWLELFWRLKSCLIYQKETLESACIRIGEKTQSEQGQVLLRIGLRAKEERQCEFCSIWEEEIKKWCKKKNVSKKMGHLLLQFPQYMREADEGLQMELFSVYVQEVQQEERLLKQRITEQQRPVMTVSLVIGLMLSILLV